MTPEDYSRIRSIFLEAREYTGDERVRFLDTRLANDAIGRDYVEALLRLEIEDVPYMQKPALGESFSLETSELVEHRSERDRLPRKIGRFRILDVLGRGGMGIVYRAEQESPRREVALKILGPDLSSRTARRRFEHEAEILGRFRHPGIAQVYEAGTIDTGDGARPFFAMELIKGEHLTEHAEQAGLTTRQKLDLLLEICNAVQYAHQKGVIHRDLKPGNILVDEMGHAKILDFGVARITDGERRSVTHATDAHQVIGTLTYMSPEQIEGDTREIDTRTDVYSLGVIGHRLLTGTLPYDFADKTLAQAVRALHETDPRRPGRLKRSLRGDMEAILLKALEKDKRRRYGSAADLAEDIRRCVRQEPILARAPTWFYPLQKLVARNRAVATVLALTLVLGFCGGIISICQIVEARELAELRFEEAKKARDLAKLRFEEASRARSETDAERVKAESVRDFLLTLLIGADPIRNQGRDITLSQVVRSALVKLDQNFAGQPDLEGELRYRFGLTLHGLGHQKEAGEQLALSTDLLTEAFGDQDLATLKARKGVAVAQLDLGHYAVAERQFRELLLLIPEDGPAATESDAVELKQNLKENLAVTLFSLGRIAEAERMTREVYEFFLERDGPESRRTLMLLSDLARIHRHRGDARQAEAIYRKALSFPSSAEVPTDPWVLRTRSAHGQTLDDLGRLDESAVIQRETLALRSQTLGEMHPDTLASLHNLSSTLRRQGLLDESEELLRRAIQGRSQILGPTHPNTLISRNNLAYLLFEDDRLDEAETEYRTLVQDAASVLSPDHWQLGFYRVGLGDVLTKKDEYVEGAAHLGQGSAVLAQHFGPRHEWVRNARKNLAIIACVFVNRGDHRRAKDLYRNLFEGPCPPPDPADPWVMTQKHRYANALIRVDRPEEAAALHEENLALRKATLGERHSETLESLDSLARAYGKLGRTEESENLVRRVIRDRTEILGAIHPMTLASRNNLAYLLYDAGRLDEAEAEYRSLLKRAIRALRNDSGTLGLFRVNFGRVLVEQGNFEEAEQSLKAGFVLDPGHHRIDEARTALELLDARWKDSERSTSS